MSAVPIQRKVMQELRARTGDQIADQLRGEKAEGDAVAAISIGGENALLSRHGTGGRESEDTRQD